MNGIQSPTRQQRVGTGILLVLVLMDLVLKSIGYRSGNSVHWGSWVLPLMVAATMMLGTYGPSYLSPRAMERVGVMTAIVAAGVLLAVFIRLIA